MFYAEKNNGSYFNNQRIRVSKKKNLEECLFATGGKEFKINLNTRKFGSAALDMAYVAAGRFDGYFQNNLKIWDIAAGIILVEESGGKINQINYDNISELKIIASSNSIYEKMSEKLDNF
jgi:myo-inositol-1(or 4)-monophosphatase